MSKEYSILLHGRSDRLLLKADTVEQSPNGSTAKFFKDKELVGEFPMHSVIGYYDTSVGKFDYE